jgi:predicted Ser/Thr protein kinase
VPDESRLLELVVRWEELRQGGQSLPAEQLCQDCPELLPALRERLATLQAMNAVLAAGETRPDANSLSGEPSQTFEQTSGEQAAARQAAEGNFPDIPGYEILRELGRGGMGVVYQARQTGLKRLVAVKMLLAGRYAAPVERARFQAEVEAIARLQHPNLVQVFEVGEREGRAFFSMECLDGGNLEDKLASGPQPPRQAAELVEVLARAIHAAHQRGVIHRDLKPANVLLTTEGVPKISDFGLAKRLDIASGPTRTQHILGTPSYMAPEQAAGRSKQVGPATDVYALGAILYEMLTGRPPFQGESVVEVVRQAAEEEPVPPRRLQSTVPADLETICLKCLEKQPPQRYASAAALADDLHRFLAGKPVLARPIGWWGRLAKWARRRPAAAGLIALGALSLLAALAAGAWFTRRLATELQQTQQARREALAAKRELETALARKVAAGLDADLRQLEMVPQSMAALLSVRVNWKEEELEAWMRALVAKDQRVFGLCVAFEPRQWVGARVHEDYCLYVYEQSGGLSAKQLLPPSYPPPFYRERDWYQVPKLTGRPSWSEPYQDPGADNTPMVTYSVPFDREGKFSGVVAADLSIEYFRGLHNRLKEQYLGPDSYSFVLSPKGTLVYHPNPLYEFPATTSSLDRIQAAPDFLALVQRMRQEETGWARATDFDTGRPAAFWFTRIPATGGHFVVVHLAPPPGEGPDEE